MSDCTKMQCLVGQSNRPYSTPVEIGLLVMRLGLGAMFLYFGVFKIIKGSEMLVMVGSSMKGFGMPLPAEFWGWCAALSEAVGGLLLALGLLFRPAVLTLLFTMIIAVITTIKTQTFFDATHALDMAIVFLGLLITGPGKLSLDNKIFGPRS